MNDNRNLRDQQRSPDSLLGEARRADFLQVVQTGLLVLLQIPLDASDAHRRARSAAEHMGRAVARSRQIPVDQDVVAVAMTFLDEVLGTDAGDGPASRRPAQREKFERTVPRWKEEIGADMLRIEALIREKPGCRSRDLKASAPHLDSYQMGWLFDQLIIGQKAYRDGTNWYPGADPRR